MALTEQAIDTIERKAAAARTGSAERMRRCRARRRAGFHCYVIELHGDEIDAFVRLGLLRADHRNDPDAVVTALYSHLEQSLGRPS